MNVRDLPSFFYFGAADDTRTNEFNELTTLTVQHDNRRERYFPPQILYAPRRSNSNHFRPIEIRSDYAEFEITADYMAYQFASCYSYNEVTRTFSIAGGGENEIKSIKPKLKKGKKYKPVDQRTHSVAATLPEEFRIIRKFPSDPLKDMPMLPTHPPEFTPGVRYTKVRMEEQNVNPDGFLWPEEEKLVHHIIRTHELAFAWDESEKGHFRSDYFEPLRLPVLPHTPWAEKNIPIPPGIRDKVIAAVKEKIASGVYEPSNSSYRSRWFCVPKKDGVSLRIVHDLQPLNAVTIKDSGCPPIVEVYAESFGGACAYGMFDLYVGFDHRILAVPSRDYSTFQTPIGTLRLTRLPQGYTNSVQVQQGDVSFILQDEIPQITQPFVDDCPVKGPTTYYYLPDGSYETIEDNTGIRRFIWEHLVNVNRICQRFRHAGGTFNAKKSFLAVPSVMIVGHRCTVDGRIPDESKVQRIKDWPICESLTEVRAFLGTLGLMRIFIKNFAFHARPLVHLTKKDVEFHFDEPQKKSMEKLKELLINSPALRAIDYTCDRQVFLSVDSSWIATGFILSQLGDNNHEYPARFGSITWNERESRYSQAKIELYGLFRALRAYRLYIVGVPNLVVRTDAKYIKGMLNNPDIQPNASINRWIAAIHLFTFELIHVPGTSLGGPDGLSRRPAAPEDEVEDDDVEEWIDRACGFSIEVLNWMPPRMRSLLDTVPRNELVIDGEPVTDAIVGSYMSLREERRGEALVLALRKEVPTDPDLGVEIPVSPRAAKEEEDLEAFQDYLENMTRPKGMTEKQFKSLTRRASGYFVKEGQLWKKDIHNMHKVVAKKDQRLKILRQIHDLEGHKGGWSFGRILRDRFYWPQMLEDVKWYIKTCHNCQIRLTIKNHIPPVVAIPFPLFGKAYCDTMHMPTIDGYSLITHARCSLSSYPEWRMLKNENGLTLADFIYEDILCRWGFLRDIVTDNGAPYIKAVEELRVRYGISHIRISGYNSQGQGIIERRHYDARESLTKACGGDQMRWPKAAHAVFWAERITIQKASGYSPFYIAHGVEPIHPFDIEQATYMDPAIDTAMTYGELITLRAMKLQHRRFDELLEIRDNVYNARCESARRMEEKYADRTYDYEFPEGSLVLLRNTTVEKELNSKMKPRYIGPMIVVRKTEGGSYILAEVSGAVSKLRVAAFRLLPYLRRSSINIDITRVISMTKAEVDALANKEDDPNLYTITDIPEEVVEYVVGKDGKTRKKRQRKTTTFRTRTYELPATPAHAPPQNIR